MALAFLLVKINFYYLLAQGTQICPNEISLTDFKKNGVWLWPSGCVTSAWEFDGPWLD